VRAIVEFRRDNPGATPMAAARSSGYRDLVRTVATTVSAQPINYLQNLGGQTVQFLYERERGAVRLLPGVSYCLRRFQPLINHLSRTRWVEHIKGNRLNTPLLGERDDLESFLFATPRQALAAIAVNLRKLVGDYCFYCSKPLQDADVDHFIPFSQYPRDLIHNFVLAHPSCNRSKGDALAAKPHLERWRDHVNRYTDQLTEIGAAAGRAANLQSSVAVARWSYGNAVAGGAQAWLRARTYTKVDRGYLEVCA